MSESRFTFVFILALVMGAAATYGVYKFINAQRLAAAQLGRIDTAAVVVLKSDVAEGAAIEKRDAEISYYPLFVGVVVEEAANQADAGRCWRTQPGHEVIGGLASGYRFLRVRRRHDLHE